MPAENTTRPVQLQVNLAGAAQVQQGALMLYEAAPNASFRIATHDRNQTVLRHMGKSTYGIWIDSKGAF